MNTKLIIAASIIVASAAALANTASAHHAFAAEFDANKPVNFKGKITKMEWINPHTWLHVDVKGADGKVVNWAIEAGTPNVLFRRGFTKHAHHRTQCCQQQSDNPALDNGFDVQLPRYDDRPTGRLAARCCGYGERHTV